MNWYILSIGSLVFFGIQKFLFKAAAENKCSTKLLTFSFMVTVAILGFIFFIITSGNFVNLKFLLILSFLNAISFLSFNVFRFEALKLVPSTVLFPLIELSNILIIFLSFLIFKDHLNSYQILGMALGLIVIYLLSNFHKDERIKYSQFVFPPGGWNR